MMLFLGSRGIRLCTAGFLSSIFVVQSFDHILRYVEGIHCEKNIAGRIVFQHYFQAFVNAVLFKVLGYPVVKLTVQLGFLFGQLLS
jgi:hypothetical protein